MWVTNTINLDENTNAMALPREPKTPIQPWRCEVGSSPQCRHKVAQASDTKSAIWSLTTHALCKVHWSSVSKGALERWSLKAHLQTVARHTFVYFSGRKGIRRSPDLEDDLNRFPDSSLPVLKVLFGHIHNLPSLVASRRHEPLHFATWAALSPTAGSTSSGCPNCGKHQHLPRTLFGSRVCNKLGRGLLYWDKLVIYEGKIKIDRPRQWVRQPAVDSIRLLSIGSDNVVPSSRTTCIEAYAGHPCSPRSAG